MHAGGSLPDRWVFSADPLYIFMLFEAGDQPVTVADGDTESLGKHGDGE